jgi:hypothetical protein
VLLAATGLLAAGLVGYLGGLVLGSVVLSGVALVGLGSLRGAGVTRAAIGFLLGSALALLGGDALGRSLGRPAGTPWLATSGGAERTFQVWSEAVRLGARFPVFGVGLNGFGAVHAQVKHDDACSSTALSSILQWWAETGTAGMLLLAAAAAWAIWKLPAAWRRVGPADRPLAGALLGSVVGCVAFSAGAWTVQLPAVALAAAALAGTLNRWLAGGTDIFVEFE